MLWRDKFTKYAGRWWEVQELSLKLSSGGSKIYLIGWNLLKTIAQKDGWSMMQESNIWCGIFDRCRFTLFFLFSSLLVSYPTGIQRPDQNKKVATSCTKSNTTNSPTNIPIDAPTNAPTNSPTNTPIEVPPNV